MAAAATAKKTVEDIATVGNAAFKDVIEKSLSGLNDLNAQSKQNLEAIVASVTATAKGVEALSAETVAYSKTAFESQVAAAKTLSGVKSVQEAFEVQSTFAKSAFEGYMAQMTKASEIMTATMKESFKPLNERVTATVELLQAAR
jgi:phasin family protein